MSNSSFWTSGFCLHTWCHEAYGAQIRWSHYFVNGYSQSFKTKVRAKTSHKHSARKYLMCTGVYSALLFLFCFVWRFSLHRTGCPGAHCVDQAGFELTGIHLFLSSESWDKGTLYQCPATEIYSKGNAETFHGSGAVFLSNWISSVAFGWAEGIRTITLEHLFFLRRHFGGQLCLNQWRANVTRLELKLMFVVRHDVYSVFALGEAISDKMIELRNTTTSNYPVVLPSMLQTCEWHIH